MRFSADKNTLVKQVLLWFAPTLFLFHNIEEEITIYSWFIRNIEFIPDLYISYIPSDINFQGLQNQIRFSIIMATVLPFLVSFIAWKIKSEKYKIYLLSLLYFALFLNAVQHVVFTVLFDKYTPGFYTALIINIPVPVCFFIFAIRKTFFDIKTMLVLLPVSAFFYMLGLFISLAFGYQLAHLLYSF